MIPKSIDQIAAADIQSLIDNGVSERRTLDYKQALPGGSDGERKEFLADVTSFANASGGDLCFGIAEAGGVPQAVIGLAGMDADAERLRLESMIRDGVAPRLLGVQLQVIDGFTSGPVLIVRVPRSWIAPHMVTFKGSSRFFTRNSAGKHPMDVTEIRAAFVLSETIPERIRNFRAERLLRIVAGETPVPLPDSPKIVLHIVPISAFSAGSQLDPSLMREHREELQLLIESATDGRFNLDGYLRYGYSIADEASRSGYCQLFRSGISEVVNAGTLYERGDRTFIPSATFERGVVACAESHLSALRRMDVPPPLVVLLSLLGVKGWEMATPQQYRKWDSTPFDRDELLLQEVVLQEYGGSVPQLLRPVFDQVWNASGWPNSPYYRDDGSWQPN